MFFFIEFTASRGTQVFKWQKVLLSVMVEKLVEFMCMDNDS